MKTQSSFDSELYKNSLLKGKVLVVDSHALNLLVITRLLQDTDYNTDTARTAKHAIDLVGSNHYDLILLDMYMPVLNGYELAAIFKAGSNTFSCPIIFTSVDCKDREVIKTGLELGAVDFVCTPIDYEILRLKIESHLRNVQNSYTMRKSVEKLKEHSEWHLQKSKSLQASVSCAERIQNSMLPDKKRLGAVDQEIFVVYQPKDTIGGDFYWVDKLNNRLIVVCADCTGHGVPGALLSMIGYNFLSQIIVEQRCFDPGEILTLLNQKMRAFFKVNSNRSMYGMDMSIAVYHPDTHWLEYAAANHTMYLQENDSVIRLQSDRRSIGDVTETDYLFTTHFEKLEGTSWLYQATDGITDQFGGPLNKKFGRDRVEATVKSMATKENAAVRKELVDRALTTWKNSNDQTDDYTFIGTKLEKASM